MHYDSLDAFLADLPAQAAPVRDKLRGHDALFLVETRQGRQLYLQLRDGEVLLSTSSDVKPDCTVKADEAALLDLVNGRLSPMKALLLRKVVLTGSPAPLMSLISLL